MAIFDKTCASLMSQFNKSTNTGITHLINATRFSAKGLRHAFLHESAFRQELAFMVILTPLAFWLGSTPSEIAILVSVLLLVLVVELLNSGLEATLDRISTDHHPLTGQAKDLGSAAVAVSLIIVVVVWCAFIYQNLIMER